MALGKTSNIEIVMEDEAGLFIRVGTSKYRPQTPEDTGSLRKGVTVRAWPANHYKNELKVRTPDGERRWPRV